MKKKFKAVKFQREAREKISKKYSADRESFIEELNKKYEHLRKKKISK
jgi:hypothetical protein